MRGLDDEAVGLVREICLALPEATEVEQWEVPTFRVRNKIFTIASVDNGRLGIWCKSERSVRDALVDADPDRFFVPPYLGKAGWIGIRLDEPMEQSELADFISESYCMIAPKRLALLVAGQFDIR